MKSLELKWGIIIGLAGMVWQYGSYYTGMHSNGLAVIQVTGLLGFGITLVGTILGLREVKKQDPELEYLEGVKSGAIMAGIAAIIGVISQIGYFKLINPGWTKYIVGQIQLLYQERGCPEAIIEEIVTQALKDFSLQGNIIQSVLGTVVMGIIFTAVIMLFLRKRRW